MEKMYTANIKMVGTVLPETEIILNKYCEIKDLDLLKNEVLDNNAVYKTSRRRAESIFYEIRKRYLRDQLDGYCESDFIYFIKNIKIQAYVNMILYYHLAKYELIIEEYLIDIVYPKYENGHLGITSDDTLEYLNKLKCENEGVSKWSDRSINDVRSALMGVLKEFGFINSRVRTVFNNISIPSIVFYYLLYKNKENIKVLEDIYNLDDMKLFLLLRNDITVLLNEGYRNEVIDWDRDSNEVKFIFSGIKEVVNAYVDGKVQ